MKNGETRKSNTIIRSLSNIVDNILLLMLFFIALIALYALWDAHQVYAEADSARFEMYKPTDGNDLSYEELREMNPDVIGWLTVYDTKIDYPVLNSKVSNDDYLSRNPFGEIEAAGSLFIDHNNSENWKDFNTIIFGHHMAERAMFGDLDLFLDKVFFDDHEYGNLYFNGKDHGVQFFSMMVVDAHAREIYNVPTTTEAAKEQYLEYIKDHTKHGRDIEITTEDQIVLLSTCSEDITNGRLILAGKVLERSVRNAFKEKESNDQRVRFKVFNLLERYMNLTVWEWIAILALLIGLTGLLWKIEHNRYQNKQKRIRKKE